MAVTLSKKTHFARYAVVTLDAVIKNMTTGTSNLREKVSNMDKKF
jgi:hypothetical protein